MSAGSLFIVSTPIGNSRDITLRAIETLKSADIVYCEDTRETKKLFAALGIENPRLESLFGANEKAKAPGAVKKMLEGADIALVSSRGTPVVSDPGFFLVKAAAEAGLKIIPVPGPSAVTAAVAAAGFSTGGGDFVFVGFLKRKPGKLKKQISRAAAAGADIVFFESAARLQATMRILADIFPPDETRVCIAREMTKVYEEFIRVKLREAAEEPRFGMLKGEVTVIVSPPKERAGGDGE